MLLLNSSSGIIASPDDAMKFPMIELNLNLTETEAKLLEQALLTEAVRLQRLRAEDPSQHIAESANALTTLTEKYVAAAGQF